MSIMPLKAGHGHGGGTGKSRPSTGPGGRASRVSIAPGSAPGHDSGEVQQQLPLGSAQRSAKSLYDPWISTPLHRLAQEPLRLAWGEEERSSNAGGNNNTAAASSHFTNQL